MILLIKLVLAHLAGDFLLQPASWVEAKEKKKLGAYQLYLHVVIHWALIMLLVWDGNFLKWAIFIAIVHFVIDILKLYLQNNSTKRRYFFADQLAHLISIYLIYCWYKGYTHFNSSYFNEQVLLLITLAVFLTVPASILIKTFIAKWTPDDNEKDKSLQNAGKYIGIIERLLIFLFMVFNHWEAIGFLLAAKSVFRFGDLRESKDRKLTEYVLIGTLLSFGTALLAGILYCGYTS